MKLWQGTTDSLDRNGESPLVIFLVVFESTRFARHRLATFAGTAENLIQALHQVAENMKTEAETESGEVCLLVCCDVFISFGSRIDWEQNQSFWGELEGFKCQERKVKESFWSTSQLLIYFMCRNFPLHDFSPSSNITFVSSTLAKKKVEWQGTWCTDVPKYINGCKFI